MGESHSYRARGRATGDPGTHQRGDRSAPLHLPTHGRDPPLSYLWQAGRVVQGAHSPGEADPTRTATLFKLTSRRKRVERKSGVPDVSVKLTISLDPVLRLRACDRVLLAGDSATPQWVDAPSAACVRRVPWEQATPRPLLNPVRRPRRSPLATTPTGWLARSDSCRLFFGSRAAVAEMTLAGVVPTQFLVRWVNAAPPQGRAEASSRPGPVG